MLCQTVLAEETTTLASGKVPCTPPWYARLLLAIYI